MPTCTCDRFGTAILRNGIPWNPMCPVHVAGSGRDEYPGDAYLPVLDDEEQEAMDHLLAFMNIVTNRWGLAVNTGELASGVHVCQGFITQHMLHRLAPDNWSDWYKAPATTEEEAKP